MLSVFFLFVCTYFKQVMLLLSSMIACAPIVARGIYGMPVLGEGATIVGCTAIVFLNVNIIYTNLSFVAVTSLDLYRRRLVWDYCTLILSQDLSDCTSDPHRSQLCDNCATIDEETKINSIDFTNHKDVYKWYQLFLVIKHFGKEFYLRATAYTAFFFVIITYVK